MKLDNTINGCYTALVTPLSAQSGSDYGTVDFDSLDNLLAYQLRAGVRGVVVCGSTGEAATLKDDEYAAVVRHVRERVRDTIPCIAGIGTSSTERACDIARLLKEIGVDGILLSAPPYNKPPQAGIVRHVERVKSSADLPIIAYNIPGRSAVNILPRTVAEMWQRGLIVAVKEASGSVDQAMDLFHEVASSKRENERGASSAQRDLSILSGEDSLVAALMACGGSGVISAVANVAPRRFQRLTDYALAGDYEKARNVQIGLLPLIRACFLETNPIAVKYALWRRGIIAQPFVRLPLVALQESTIERLERVLETEELP